MNFFYLNDDVKSIISKHVFDNDLIMIFEKNKKIQNDVQENDDFNNAKICKIYNYIND